MRTLALVLLAIVGASLALTPQNPPYGALSVKGSKLVGANGPNVQLAGMSLYWSQVSYTRRSCFCGNCELEQSSIAETR